MNPKSEEYNDEEAARRCAEVIKRMLELRGQDSYSQRIPLPQTRIVAGNRYAVPAVPGFS